MDSVSLEGDEGADVCLDCTGEADGVDGPRKDAKRLMDVIDVVWQPPNLVLKHAPSPIQTAYDLRECVRIDSPERGRSTLTSA